MNIKKEFWLLLASFILPIVLGTAFFYWNPTYFTQNTVNYGQFVSPVITTEKQDIMIEGDASVQGLWTLTYVAKNCDEYCIKVAAEMKKIRTLMNDKMRRIQRMVLINNDVSVKEFGLLVAKPSIELSNKLAEFPPNSIFLIDPIGNIMLRYDAKNINIKRVLKDLNRLFKYSRIG